MWALAGRVLAKIGIKLAVALVKGEHLGPVAKAADLGGEGIGQQVRSGGNQSASQQGQQAFRAQGCLHDGAGGIPKVLP